ncbi:MAG: SpoIIE family protein phosphatase [Treponema sp.]|nr:SpoIIE family protein phosphatase [Treponema sp.]
MKKKYFSVLGFKLLVSAIFFVALLCVVLSVAGYRHFKKVFEAQYNRMTMEFAYIAASYVDGDSIDDYLNSQFKDEKWLETYAKLSEVVNVADLQALSISVPDTIQYNLQEYVYHCVNARLADKVRVYNLGEPELLSTRDKKSLVNMKKLMLLGRLYTEYTYTNKDGDISRKMLFGSVSGYATTVIPIRDSYNNVVAMLSVEKSMDEVLALQKEYQHTVFIVGITIALVFILLYGLSLWYSVIRPVGLITQETAYFAQHGSLSGSIKKIRNHDEMGSLAKSVEKMSEDINNYINKLTTVTAEKERISTELNVATKIQADMLPKAYPAYPERTDFDLSASMDPAKEVGGDLYDYMLLDDDHLMMVVGDVSGKGVPAALFMVIAKTLLDSHGAQRLSPAEIFSVTNDQLCSGNESGLFVTCWLGILTFSTGELRFVNAGHPYPVLYHKGEFSFVQTKPNFVLGGMEGVPYKEHTITMEKGDRLLVYTDGVTEATNASEELFGEARLLEAMPGTEKLTAPETLVSVRKSIDAFVGEAEQFDDITLLSFIWK